MPTRRARANTVERAQPNASGATRIRFRVAVVAVVVGICKFGKKKSFSAGVWRGKGGKYKFGLRVRYLNYELNCSTYG